MEKESLSLDVQRVSCEKGVRFAFYDFWGYDKVEAVMRWTSIH